MLGACAGVRALAAFAHLSDAHRLKAVLQLGSASIHLAAYEQDAKFLRLEEMQLLDRQFKNRT
jgi:hypothetical protein